MATPAPSPAPLGLSESVRAVFARLETDPKLVGKGLSSAFAASFPDLPAEATGLAATEAARVAVILGVPGIAVMDVTQLASSAAAALTLARPETRRGLSPRIPMLIMHRSVVTSVQTLHKRYLLAMGV